jgi:hypothetical protein
MQHRHAASICSMDTLMDMQLGYACSCCMSTRVLAVCLRNIGNAAWKHMDMPEHACTVRTCMAMQHEHAYIMSMQNRHTNVHTFSFAELRVDRMTWVRWSQCTRKPPEPDVCFHYWRVHRTCTNREKNRHSVLRCSGSGRSVVAVAGCTIVKIASRTAAWDATEVHHLMAGCSLFCYGCRVR